MKKAMLFLILVGMVQIGHSAVLWFDDCGDLTGWNTFENGEGGAIQVAETWAGLDADGQEFWLNSWNGSGDGYGTDTAIWNYTPVTVEAEHAYTLTVKLASWDSGLEGDELGGQPADAGDQVYISLLDGSDDSVLSESYVWPINTTPGNDNEYVNYTVSFDTYDGNNSAVVGNGLEVYIHSQGWWNQFSISEMSIEETTLGNVAPTIAQQPESKRVYTDVMATFSIVTGGFPAPTVQWYDISGSVTNPISGATNLSYTTPPATLGMDGTAYFAVASNAGGTAASEAATLAVAVGAADANEVFSVQLGDPATGGYLPLEPNEMTGAYPITNWNPVFVKQVAPSVEQKFALNDQYGIGSGVELIIRGASDAYRFDDPPANTEPGTKLMNAFIKSWYRPDEFGPNEIGEGKMELILTNLNDAVNYSVYVYLADNDGFEANVDVGTGVINYTGTLPSTLPSSFIASTNQDEFGTRDPGNYVRQSGVTPVNGAIKITVDYYDPGWIGYGVGVCGLQVLEENRDVFAPVFEVHPVSRNVAVDTTATLSAAVLGSPSPTVQWYEIDGNVTNLIGGATSLSYTTPTVTDATSGRGYFMTALNTGGTASSQVAYVTSYHLVMASGFLQVDQYYGTTNVADVLNPVWRAANMPDNTYWIESFENLSQLPDESCERIHGLFTPPVTDNYVFFISADDDALLLLSTDDTPANGCQIAYEEVWSSDGTSWTSSGGGSSLAQKRSDQFGYIPWLPGAPWPGGGTISLTAGVPHYIEVGHRQGGGGQSAAVTYSFEGDSDPANGTSTVISGPQISTLTYPDYLLPIPLLTLHTSGPDLILSCSNGRSNGIYNVESHSSLIVSDWTFEETGFFDAEGNFMLTLTPTNPVRFYRVLSY